MNNIQFNKDLYYSKISTNVTSAPLFVTWYYNETILKGCIGTFTPIELKDGLLKYTEHSINDSRFIYDKITMKIYNGLTCTVSILSNFEETTKYNWDIGKHGLQITIDGMYSSIFLPEVAEENNWSKDETINNLISKSGYSKKIDFDNIKFVRYISTRYTAKYSDIEKYLQ